jgi:hypothetical protein
MFLDQGSEIRDPGWVKIRIRDKHPGSATLRNTSYDSTFYNYVEENQIANGLFELNFEMLRTM